jgi:hypothetical protein
MSDLRRRPEPPGDQSMLQNEVAVESSNDREPGASTCCSPPGASCRRGCRARVRRAGQVQAADEAALDIACARSAAAHSAAGSAAFTRHLARPRATHDAAAGPPPWHVTVHDVAPSGHRTPDEQDPPPLHTTSQLQPAGQATSSMKQPPLRPQSIVQVLSPMAHEVHCDGHGTQSPSTQTRELGHSLFGLHATWL